MFASKQMITCPLCRKGTKVKKGVTIASQMPNSNATLTILKMVKVQKSNSSKTTDDAGNIKYIIIIFFSCTNYESF